MRTCLVAVLAACAVASVTGPLNADWSVVSDGPTGIAPTSSAVFRGVLFVGIPGGVARYEGTSWHMHYLDGLPVWHMQVYADRLYAQTSRDVYRFDGSTWSSVGPGLDESVRGFDIDVTNGRLYFATNSSVHYRDPGGSLASIAYPGSIALRGMAVHAGTIVVRDYSWTLSYHTGGTWHQVSTSLDFLGTSQIYYGPRGLFVCNSERRMPIDLTTGQPTSDSHDTYWFAEVQSSENKAEVFISGSGNADELPAIVDASGVWTAVEDPHLDQHALLTRSGSSTFLSGDDYVAVLGAGGTHTEVGFAAPLPYFEEIVASGDNLYALGANTVWMRHAGGPWQVVRDDYLGTSLAPGDGGEVWVGGYGEGDHPNDDWLHILADGTVEGERITSSIYGSAPIVVHEGSLYAFDRRGLWRRQGRETWVRVADWEGSVSGMSNYRGVDPPLLYHSPILGTWSTGCIARDPSGAVLPLWVEFDTWRWSFLPMPQGWSYPEQAVLWNGELYLLAAGSSEAAVFKWREATWDWQQLSNQGLPSDWWINDLLATPAGLVALGADEEDYTSFGSFLYSGGSWHREGSSSLEWGPGVGAYLASRQTVFAGGLGSGLLMRHSMSDLIADFTWQPLAPAAGQELRFEDLSLGAVSGWQWGFGDGGTSSVQHPTHAYAAAGTYTVSLTVSGSAGSASASARIAVGPAPQPPVAQFSFSPQEPAVGEQVQFTDLSSGDPTSWQWSFGDGGTSSSQHPTHAYSSCGSHAVSLTVSNAGGSHSVTATLRVLCPPGEARVVYIPAVANNPGSGGTSWNTDAELSNRGTEAATYEVHLLRTAQGNSDPDVAGPFTLAAGQGARHLDIVETLFGASTSGALRVVLDEGATSSGTTLVTSRTYNDSASGTYGQYIPGVAEEDLIPAGLAARLIQLTDNAAFRTNLGLLNGTDAMLTVQVRYGLADGTALGEESITLEPYEHRQFRAFTRVTSDAVNDGHIELETLTTGGLFFGYASVIDNLSGDPICVEPLAESAAGAVVYLPAAANNPGSGGTSWNTDAEVANPGATPISYEVHLLRTAQGNSNPETAGPFTLGAGCEARHDDAVQSLFGVETSGALRLVVDGGGSPTASVLVTSRTFNDSVSGTYGQYIPGVAEDDLIPAGSAVCLIQLTDNAAFRTNLGLLNGTDAMLTVQVRYGLADGTALGEELIALEPFEHRQLRAFTRVTGAAVDDGTIELEALTAGGRFYGYASVVDNLSGDPVFVRPL